MADGLNKHGVLDLNNPLKVLRASELLCSDVVEGHLSEIIGQHADIIIVGNGSRLELLALFAPLDVLAQVGISLRVRDLEALGPEVLSESPQVTKPVHQFDYAVYALPGPGARLLFID